MASKFTFGLALSGGGFRAALFHLGVLKYLHTTGLIGRVSHICSVSGGSIVAADLCTRWEEYHQDFDGASKRLIDFIQHDIRGRIIRRWLFRPIIKKWTRTNLLERYYRDLYSPQQVDRAGGNNKVICGPRPKLLLLTTDLNTARMYGFMGGHVVVDEGRLSWHNTQLPSLAVKVALSSAFPALFPPKRLTNEDLGINIANFGYEHNFTDGGVYDNLGIRMFQRLYEHKREGSQNFPPWLVPAATDGGPTQLPSLVLVSDASGGFDHQRSESRGIFATALRAVDILMHRIGELDRQLVCEGDEVCKGRFWPVQITTTMDANVDPLALGPSIQNQLPFIRTDLDAFTDLEIRCLTQHGICVVQHRLRELRVECERREQESKLPEAWLSWREALEKLPAPDTKRWDPLGGRGRSEDQPVLADVSDDNAALVDRQTKSLQRSARAGKGIVNFSDLGISALILLVGCALLVVLAYIPFGIWRAMQPYPDVVKGWGYSMEDMSYNVTLDGKRLRKYAGKSLLLVVARQPQSQADENDESYLADANTVQLPFAVSGTEPSDVEQAIDCQQIGRQIEVGDSVRCSVLVVPRDWGVSKYKSVRQLQADGAKLIESPGVDARPRPEWKEDRACKLIRTTKNLRIGISTGDEQGMLLFQVGSKQYKPEKAGYEISLIKEIAARLPAKLGLSEPVTLDFQEVPWKQLLSMPIHGDADAIISSISFSAAREDKFGLSFSIPYKETTLCLMSQKKPIASIKAALQNNRVSKIAVKAGTTSEVLVSFLALNPNYHCTPVPIDSTYNSDVAKKVISGEADFAVIDTPYAEALKNGGQLENADLQICEFTEQDFPDAILPEQRREQYVIGVAAGNRKLLWAINNTLIELAQDNPNKLKKMEQEASERFKQSRILGGHISEASESFKNAFADVEQVFDNIFPFGGISERSRSATRRSAVAPSPKSRSVPASSPTKD